MSSSPGWRRLFEIEDLFLFLWALALERVAVALMGGNRSSWLEGGTWGSIAFAVIAVAGALFVAVTESDRRLTLDQAVMRRVLLFGPLYPCGSILAALAQHVVHVKRKAAMPPGTTWAQVPEPEGWPGPHAPQGLRRAAVVPYALLGDAFVRHLVADAETRLAFTDRHWFTDLTVPLVTTFATYLFFVVGPRVAAGATWNPLVWLPRFASYFAALGFARWGVFG